MTSLNDEPSHTPPGAADDHARPEETALITALSTLTARVAVLERWMRGSQRREALLIAMVAIALFAGLVLLTLR